jgi:hypothetical protein
VRVCLAEVHLATVQSRCGARNSSSATWDREHSGNAAETSSGITNQAAESLAQPPGRVGGKVKDEIEVAAEVLAAERLVILSEPPVLCVHVRSERGVLRGGDDAIAVQLQVGYGCVE